MITEKRYINLSAPSADQVSTPRRPRPGRLPRRCAMTCGHAGPGHRDEQSGQYEEAGRRTGSKITDYVRTRTQDRYKYAGQSCYRSGLQIRPNAAPHDLPAAGEGPLLNSHPSSASRPFAARQHDGSKDGVVDEMAHLQGPARTPHSVLISSRPAIRGRPVMEQPPERGDEHGMPVTEIVKEVPSDSGRVARLLKHSDELVPILRPFEIKLLQTEMIE